MTCWSSQTSSGDLIPSSLFAGGVPLKQKKSTSKKRVASYHGCWETVHIFAYCGLVGNPHLSAKNIFVAPLPTSTKVSCLVAGVRLGGLRKIHIFSLLQRLEAALPLAHRRFHLYARSLGAAFHLLGSHPVPAWRLVGLVDLVVVSSQATKS